MCEQDDRDWRVSGGNPCLEQSLESFEMCCLVETFPARHESKEDYLDTLKYAFLYAKTVTLGSTHWSKTNQVMLRNRRIGCSMSGVAQFTAQHGLPGLLEWCEEGYDQVQKIDATLSEWLAIPESIKTTSVKPSGTVSLLAGATPGKTRTTATDAVVVVVGDDDRCDAHSLFLLPPPTTITNNNH